jgi:hypothetical protein
MRHCEALYRKPFDLIAKGLYCSNWLPLKDNEVIKGYIRLARPLIEVKASLDQQHHVVLLSAFIIVLPSFLLGIIFSRSIASRLTPVEKALKKNM